MDRSPLRGQSYATGRLTQVRGQRPQGLVFTLFGEYLLERSDSVWVGSLIALLEPFGLTEGGARTVLSRMAKKGVALLGAKRPALVLCAHRARTGPAPGRPGAHLPPVLGP